MTLTNSDTGIPSNEQYEELDLSIEEDKIYQEFLEWADPSKALAWIARLDKLEEWRGPFRREILIKNAEIEAAKPREPEKKYSAPTMRWRAIFKGVKDRAQFRIANQEESEWEDVYDSQKSGSKSSSRQLGASTKQWIIKNKHDYLTPGVWHLRSKNVFDPDTKVFITSKTQVRYVSDATEMQSEPIFIITDAAGRPKI